MQKSTVKTNRNPAHAQGHRKVPLARQMDSASRSKAEDRNARMGRASGSLISQKESPQRRLSRG